MISVIEAPRHDTAARIIHPRWDTVCTQQGVVITVAVFGENEVSLLQRSPGRRRHRRIPYDSPAILAVAFDVLLAGEG